MRKILFGVLLMIFAVNSVGVYSQCDHEVMLKKALEDMGDGQYIKDFIVDLEKDKDGGQTGYTKFSVILNSKSQYKFNVVESDSNTKPVLMQLYDGDELLMSNRRDGKYHSAFGFVCGTTKLYSLVFSFEGGKEGCARGVLSLMKQFSENEMQEMGF
jgi:hypothetical protein